MREWSEEVGGASGLSLPKADGAEMISRDVDSDSQVLCKGLILTR